MIPYTYQYVSTQFMVNFALKSCSHFTWRFNWFFFNTKKNIVCASHVTIEEQVTLYSSIFIMFTIWNYYVFNLARISWGRSFFFTSFTFRLHAMILEQLIWRTEQKHHNMSVYDSWMNLSNVLMTGKKTSHKCRVYGFIDTINLNWFSFIGFYNIRKKCFFLSWNKMRYDGETKMHLLKSLTFEVVCYVL